jgi:hypothetical protein
MGGLNSMLESLGGSALRSAEVPVEASSPSNLVLTSLEERALSLLGSGCNSESVASALGVHPSRISQLLAEKVFADKVSELRYKNLQKHNARDGAYDSIEDRLLEKLDKAMPLMVRPETILKAISIVNGAKRRGASAPDQVTNQQNIVNIIMPKVISQKFTVNINNQVTRAGDQDLMTMPSGNLLKQVEAAEALRLEAGAIEGTHYVSSKL